MRVVHEHRASVRLIQRGKLRQSSTRSCRSIQREERRMAGKKQQTHAKRARELAVKERRERKRAKKAEAAALRAAGGVLPESGNDLPEGEQQPEPAVSEWIR